MINRRNFLQTTSLATAGVMLTTPGRAAESAFPIVRIPEAKRKFKSAAVEKAIQRVQSSIGNR